MTTVSFRADDATIAALEAEAERAGASKSELLLRAVREFLYRLACERDADLYGRAPLTESETELWLAEAWVDDAPGTDWNEVFYK